MKVREIKFRAWSDFERLMSYDVTVFPNGWFKVSFSNGFTAKYLPESGLKVMQYTGLKDKNGKKIYEGDIVNFDGEPYRVDWYEREFTLFNLVPHNSYKKNNGYPQYPFLKDGRKYCINLEVIGNIYETPKLLKADEAL